MWYSFMYLEKKQFNPNASSIHSFSSAYPGPGRGGSCLSRDTQTSLSPDTSTSYGWPQQVDESVSQRLIFFVIQFCEYNIEHS